MKITRLQLKIILFIIALLVLAAVVYYAMHDSDHHTYQFYSASPEEEQQLRTRLDTLLRSSPVTKDVILRSAYFDDRARNGHSEIGVFLIAAKRFIFDSKLFVGCGVEKQVSTNFTVVSTQESYLMHKWFYRDLGLPLHPYDEYILECYNVHMTNNSAAFILYKRPSDSLIHVANSKFPLMFPAPKVKPTEKYDFSVVTCTEAHNKEVAWLPEFIRYQKTTGIDRVHINILDTFVKDGGLEALLKDPQVAKGVAEGYVTMTVWKDEVEAASEIFSFSAILRKLDCVYRFRGTYDYAFLLDSDDFFTPLVNGKTYLKDYIQDWCRGDSSIGSCMFQWFYYYPEACGVRNETAKDGNITRLLKSYKYYDNNHFKSAHLLSAVLDTGFHHAECINCLLPGYSVHHVPPHLAYVAHLRMKAKPRFKC
jgi:hypothetical protein